MRELDRYLAMKKRQIDFLYRRGKILLEDRDHLYRDIEQIRKINPFFGQDTPDKESTTEFIEDLVRNLSFLETCIAFSKTCAKIEASSERLRLMYPSYREIVNSA